MIIYEAPSKLLDKACNFQTSLDDITIRKQNLINATLLTLN